MATRSQELAIFQKALEDDIKPIAERFDLSFTKISETLYAIVAPSFTLKFYCMGGHGCSFTVTVAPTHKPFCNGAGRDRFPLAGTVRRQA
jgi:hypothetical protein